MTRPAHPTIDQVAADAGYTLGDPSSMRQMQAHHREPISREDVALIENRLRLGTDLALARDQGEQRPSAAAADVDRAVLRVIAPIAHEIADWRAMRDDGEKPEVIAVRAGQPPPW